MLIQEQRVDFQHRQGKTFRRQLFLKSAESGATIDLTGCRAAMQLRESVDADEVALELTTENGRIGIIGEFGQISLYIEDDITAALAAGTYVYDLEIYDSLDETSSPMFGKFKITPEVTR